MPDSSYLVKPCFECGQEVKRLKSQLKKTSGNVFCNRSCASKFNNKKYIKVKRKRACKACQKPIICSRRFCEDCRSIAGKDITLQEAIYFKHHRSSAFALVRARARAVLKRLDITFCQNCGYSKHIEACHIKPIKDFPLDTNLSVINDVSNLLGLCPNCHWELDHGFLDLSSLMK